jgi:hypothetical protein
VQNANSIMERAREITTERAVQKLGADIIETLIDTLDIRLCAHVQKRPLQGDFKSLLEIAGQFGSDFRTACQHARAKFTDEPPKEWILPTTAAAATVSNTSVSKVTELRKGKLTASQVAVHFKTHKVEAGKKVTENSSRRVLVVEEINDTSVVLVEEGRKRKERFAVADFLRSSTSQHIRSQRAHNTNELIYKNKYIYEQYIRVILYELLVICQLDVPVRALHARMRACTPCWARAHMRTCTVAPERVFDVCVFSVC